MAKKMTTTTVSTATFKNVFAAYPELKYDLAFLTNEGRDLIIQCRTKAGFEFLADKHGRVLSLWLGEKVGEFRLVKFDSFEGGILIVFKALRNYKFALVREAIPTEA